MKVGPKKVLQWSFVHSLKSRQSDSTQVVEMRRDGSEKECKEIYVQYFKAIRKAGVFPYIYDPQRNSCVIQRNFLFIFNILTAILIFIKQSYLLLQSIRNFDPEETHSDLMFRTMWFLGSLFLSSMFAVHIFYASQVATFVPLWIRTERRVSAFTLTSFDSPSCRLKSRKNLFSLALKFYLMMWIGSQIFMGVLYAWNPEFYPFLYSVLGGHPLIRNLVKPMKILIILLLGMFEVNFIGLAMVNMAGFDLLLGFIAVNMKDCLKNMILTMASNFARQIASSKVLSFYFQLQVLVIFINHAFSTVIFIHLIVVFLMIPFFIYGIEHYSVSPQTTIFFFWCIFFQVVRIASIWMPLALVKTESTDALKRLRIQASPAVDGSIVRYLPRYQMYERKLKACQVLVFTSGRFNKISVGYVMKFVFFATSYMVIFLG